MINPVLPTPESLLDVGACSFWCQLTLRAAALRRAGAGGAVLVGASASPYIRLRLHRCDGRRRTRHHTLARLGGGDGDRG